VTKIDQSALLPYSDRQMFDLVNDIESYPDFMEGCLDARILQREDNEVTASLSLGKAGLRYGFTTRNSLSPPSAMTMTLVEGPFRTFAARWHFTALGASACKVSLAMEFEFSSGLVDTALRHLFNSASKNLVNAVCRRADRLYGRQ